MTDLASRLPGRALLPGRQTPAESRAEEVTCRWARPQTPDAASLFSTAQPSLESHSRSSQVHVVTSAFAAAPRGLPGLTNPRPTAREPLRRNPPPLQRPFPVCFRRFAGIRRGPFSSSQLGASSFAAERAASGSLGLCSQRKGRLSAQRSQKGGRAMSRRVCGSRGFSERAEEHALGRRAPRSLWRRRDAFGSLRLHGLRGDAAGMDSGGC